MYWMTLTCGRERLNSWRKKTAGTRSATVASTSSRAANQAAKCKPGRRHRHPRKSALVFAERGRYQGRLGVSTLQVLQCSSWCLSIVKR
ncbi:hypothetical protein GQ600_4485 [Phytophthora cactorum]|nr:hypothetical protein GQ600_4485 [Phytophthora cactorum]